MDQIFKYKNYALGFREYGKPDGIPLMHFHVRGGSRFEGKFFHEKARELNIRIVCLERPGYGLSDFFKWTLKEWTEIVCAFADTLDWDRFSVSGISGGAVHALACAFYIHDRLKHCEVISTIGPPEYDYSDFPRSMKFALWSVNNFSLFYRLQLALERKFYRNSKKLLAMIKKNMNKMNQAEYEVYSNQDLLNIYCLEMGEGMKKSLIPMIYELALLNRSWGFDLKTLNFPLSIWHGEEDFAYKQIQRMVKDLPNAQCRFFPKQGHLSVPLLNIEEILSSIRDKVIRL